MPDNWKTYKLGEILKVKHGYAFKGKYFTTEPNKNLLLTPGNFEKDGGIKFNWVKQKFYIGEYPEDYILSPNSLVIAMTDLTQACDILGAPLLIKDSKFHYLHNQRLGLVQENEKLASKNFLFYYFNSRKYRDRLVATKTGSTVSHTAPERIYDCEVNLPPLPEQKSIASILSALDDKIELNLQMNKTLEEMAMALYKHWFVDFGPFQEGEFVNSELGEIPKGWEVKEISDIAEVNSKSVGKKNKIGIIEYIDISSVGEGSVGQIQTIPFSESPSRARRIISDGDIVWSTVRPNRKSRFLALGFSSQTIVSTGFAVISPRTVSYAFLYPFTCTEEFVDYLVSRATGSSYPAVTGKIFEDAKLVVPTPQVMESYNKFVEPLYLQFSQNNKENQTLTQLRDTLLPKLISGEVRVKEAEKIFSEVL